MWYALITGILLVALIFFYRLIDARLPAWVSWEFFLPVLLILNFFDWYTTIVIVESAGNDVEGNPFYKLLLTAPPFVSAAYKLGWGSLLCVIVSFLKREIPLATATLFILTLMWHLFCIFKL